MGASNIIGGFMIILVWMFVIGVVAVTVNDPVKKPNNDRIDLTRDQPELGRK